MKTLSTLKHSTKISVPKVFPLFIFLYFHLFLSSSLALYFHFLICLYLKIYQTFTFSLSFLLVLILLIVLNHLFPFSLLPVLNFLFVRCSQPLFHKFLFSVWQLFNLNLKYSSHFIRGFLRENQIAI